MNARCRGQAAVEFLLCAGLLAATVFIPVFDDRSAVSFLAHQVVAWFHGFYELLSLT